MKARYSSTLAGLALSCLPFVGGCTEESGQSSLIGTANAQPVAAVVAADPPVPAPASTNADAAPVTAEAAAAEPEPVAVAVEPAPGAVRTLPNVIRTNSPALDVIKLAQAGVDESVMLNFITNANSMFLLTSDEIIYLNDIGVPSTVVTAMMQRDQTTRVLWANASQAATAAPAPAPDVAANEPQTAAAPSYVNPPEAQPVPEPQPTVVNNNYFNDNLSPYGTWVNVDGYGRVWQPTVVVVNRNWRPYSDGGRWVYTDAGWYWLSDYSWGATTFHYGRWFNHARYGWCWWPDTVWGPSWVSFRYSGDYCGWAPLPPHSYYRSGLGFSYYGRSVGFSFDFGISSSCYTFVNWNRFCDNRPWHYRARPHEATRIYNNTTIVNNYVTGDNNTVINRGIGRDRVRDLTRTEIKTVAIRDAGPNRAAAGTGARAERLERDGRTLVVNRPQMPSRAHSSNLTGTRSERPGNPSSVAPNAPANLGRPARIERQESAHTAPSTTPNVVNQAPSAPATPTTRAPEGRSTRSRELPGGNLARPNPATTPTVVGRSRTETGSTPSAPATVPNAPTTTTPQTPSRVGSPAPTRPTRPNLVVVGKPQTAAPAGPTYQVNPQRVAPSQPQAVNTPQATPERQEIPRVTRSISSPAPARPQTPTYNAPTPAGSVPAGPSYSPPTRSYESRPTPSYNPPPAVRSAPSSPAPSYSPPPAAVSRPAPASPGPSYNPPSRSSSSERSGGSGPSRPEGGRRER